MLRSPSTSRARSARSAAPRVLVPALLCAAATAPAQTSHRAAPKKALPKAAAPKTAAPTTGATRDVLKCDDFEVLDAEGNPVGWQFPANGAAFLVAQEDGGRFVRLRPLGSLDARKIMAPIRLQPSWRRLKFSARVRGEGLQIGGGQYQTPHVGVVFFNREGEVAGFSDGIVLGEDAGWAQKSVTVVIPRDATLAMVDAGNFGKAGDFFVDDIIVRPDEARAEAASAPSRRA